MGSNYVKLTWAPHGINPSVLNLFGSYVSVHGKNLHTIQFHQGEVIFYKSLVLYDIHGNKSCQIDLITGAPHGINSSSLNLFGVCLYMGRIYVLLFKNQLDGVLPSLMNHSYVHCIVNLEH